MDWEGVSERLKKRQSVSPSDPARHGDPLDPFLESNRGLVK